MHPRKWPVLSALVLFSGCLYHAKERADQAVCELAAKPFDLAPAEISEKKPDQESKSSENKKQVPGSATDVQAAAYLEEPPKKPPSAPDLRIPPEIPGSETPPLNFENMTEAQKREALKRLYPALPDLPTEPKPLPGPAGNPYTLSELQRLAAENSPLLRQAAADVETARGNVVQARAYPNPTVGYESDNVNTGATAGYQGFFWDQPIKTAGKLKLQTAAAEMDLRNYELALRRAHNDLATSVRNAYFAVLIAKETVRVTKGLARFTEQVYQIQANLNLAGLAAAYEPASLRSQAYTARLAHKQALSSYMYAWKQLVTAIGERQLPLSEVAGRLDAAIPYYDYDEALSHVLRAHTDLAAALNTIEKARYNLKLAQITPFFQDMDVRAVVQKDFTTSPFLIVHNVQLGMALPIWDQNRGNILAQEGSLARASQEPQRVELNLTNTFATAYLAYKNNLDALEYYRHNILPDQVRAYRGIYERRQVDLNLAFADLVTAQQNLTTGVTTYLTILNQLWTSVVSVADLLQTDDLYQMAKPKALPPLPDLESLPAWDAPLQCTATQFSQASDTQKTLLLAPGKSAAVKKHSPGKPALVNPADEGPTVSTQEPFIAQPTAPFSRAVSSKLRKAKPVESQFAEERLLEPPPKIPTQSPSDQ